MCAPSKLARPGVVLHPFVEDSDEQDGPSKGGEDHDVKHERPCGSAHPTVMLLRGSGNLMETEPTGFQSGGDHFMSTITTLIGNAGDIDILDVYGANGFCDGHERGFAPLASWVPASASDAHHVLQCVRADVESPRPPHWNGLNNRPHLIVGLDSYEPVSLLVVDFSDSEVASSNLELQREVISQATVRELIEPITNIAPSAIEVDLGNMPDPRCLQKTLIRHIDA